MHHLGDVLDRYHLAFQHGKNFGQGHRAYLHVAQRKLFARDPASEIVHQFFFAHGEAFHDPPFLSLERLALEHLWNSPTQKIDSPLHVFLEGIGFAARQRQQTRPVRQFEIIDIAAIERFFRRRMKLFDHPRDRSAAAGPRQPAYKNVVSGRRKLRAHLQCAQRTFLSDEPFAQLRLRGCFEGDARELTSPPQFRRGKLRGLQGRFNGHEFPSSALL